MNDKDRIQSLYIDAVTGKYVAKEESEDGVCGLQFRQNTESDEWNVKHNRNFDFFISAIFSNENGALNKVIPDSIRVINSDEITINFDRPIKGIANILYYVDNNRSCISEYCASIACPIDYCTSIACPIEYCASITCPIEYCASIACPIEYCVDMVCPIEYCASISCLSVLPVNLTNTGNIFTVCKDIVNLNSNLILDTEADIQRLTFSWTQIDGPLVVIQNADTFDATIDVRDIPVADRTFRLVINESIRNSVSVDIEVLSQILSSYSGAINNYTEDYKISWGEVSYIWTTGFDYDNLAFSSEGCSTDFYPSGLEINNSQVIHGIELQEVQKFNTQSKQWDTISSVNNPPEFYFVEADMVDIHRIRTLWIKVEDSSTHEEFSDIIRVNPLFTPALLIIRPAFSNVEGFIGGSITPAYYSDLQLVSVVSDRVELSDLSYVTSSVTSSNVVFSNLNLITSTSERVIPDTTESKISGSISTIQYKSGLNLERLLGSNITT